MCERVAKRLQLWIGQALRSSVAELGSCAKGLLLDFTAVATGISIPWSSGQTEGRVSLLKLIKRTMYGRVGFAFLSQRILALT